MSEQLTLDLREHDLPPEWDGAPIEWEAEWFDDWQPTICPPPKDARTCDECGSTRPTLLKRGAVGPYLQVYRTPYNQIRRRQHRDHITALRCPDCRTDAVICPEGKYWVLGPEDYGPRGSYMQEVDDDADA